MYFKILKNNMVHNNFQYKEGLNTDRKNIHADNDK